MNAPLRRREFLTSTAAATGAALLCSGPASPLPRAWAAPPQSGEEALPIIDTHQHLWDLDKFQLPWLADLPALRRSYVTADYLEATRGLNVRRAVYMEVDVTPSQQKAEAEHVIGLCKSDQHPTVAAVISGRPAEEGFREYVSAYRDSPYIKGVRQVLHVPSTPPGTCLRKPFVRSVQLLGEMGLRFDMCMRPADLGDSVQLAQRCPDTRLVLDHCGNGRPEFFAQGANSTADLRKQRDQWRKDIHRLAQHDNVVCKISGIVVHTKSDDWTASDLAPIVNHCLDEFGPDRVMFGGDWPVCTLRSSFARWVQALREIVAERSVEDQRKLLHDNAQRFYELG